VLGLPLFVDWVRDQSERFDPDIHPHDTIDPSSFNVPFNVINKSMWVPMTNVKLSCGIDLLYFIDADRKTGILKDVVFSTGEVSVLRGKPIQYHCDASRFVHLEPAGSLTTGFPSGQAMKTKPAAFRPPLTVVKMCVGVGGEYKIFGFTHRFSTAMFQWPLQPGLNQWIEGWITTDDSNDRWIPELVGAWGLRAIVDNDRNLLPGALQCTPTHWEQSLPSITLER
jgi:hypothetical protein